MRTVKELYDIALAFFISQKGGMAAFRGFLESKCRFGELTERQKSDLLEVARVAVERYGGGEQEAVANAEPSITKEEQPAGKRTTFTAREVGELIGCSANTVYRMVKKNEIPYKSDGRSVRFDADDLGRWMGSRAFKEWERHFTPKIRRKTRDLSEMRKDENGVMRKVYLANPLKAYRRQEAAALLGITVGHLKDLVREGKIRRDGAGRDARYWGGDLIKYRERHPGRGGRRGKSPSLFEDYNN